MHKIYKLFFLLFVAVFAVSCDPDSGSGKTKVRDYQEQYDKDMVDILQFMKTHTYSVVNHPGFADDQNVTFTQVPELDPTCIWLDTAHLKTRITTKNDVEYTIYYLKLREGGGAANDKPFPCNVDAVLASYTGKYIFHSVTTDEDTGVVTDSLKTYEFESVLYPQGAFNLEGVIRGWSEVFPQFKGGDITQVSGEPTLYNDFGAGVMFIPSGLGYYNQGGSIPAYSPLIFTFKLYEITRLDQDGDGIPSYLEDLNGDRYMYVLDESIDNPDDTDGDQGPDYLDLDDDGDFVLTKVELRRPKQNPDDENEEWTYYKYNGDADDDPTTPFINETYGVPSCFTIAPTYVPGPPKHYTYNSPNDFLSPTRLRRYLDPNCKPPYGDEIPVEETNRKTKK